MTEQCKKEIIVYVDSKGFKLDMSLNNIYGDNDTPYLLINSYNEFKRGYFMDSEEGIKRKLENKFEKLNDDWETLDKYFLEFIGHILRKHNIKEVNFTGTFYESTDWKFENIKNF